MPRSSSTSKRPARRCSLCNAVGHNKATCTTAPATVAAAPSAPVKPGLKFFVHHVTTAPEHSPHVVNLKHSSDIWEAVQAIAPEAAPELEHHFDTPIRDFLPPPAVPQPAPIRPLPVAAPAKPLHAITPKQPSRLRLALGEKWEDVKNGARNVTLPKHLAPKLLGAALAVALFLIVPGSAKTYYEDLTDSFSQITENGLAGFEALEQSLTALTHGNVDEALTTNRVALSRLAQATTDLHQSHPTLQTIAAGLPIVGGKLRSGQELLIAGQELSLGNSYVLAALADAPTTTLLAKFNAFAGGLTSALPHYQSASAHLDNVDVADLPTKFQGELPASQALLSAATHDLSALVNLQGVLQEIFGGEGMRTYLLVFQNQHEMRPTGGFMGSVAIMSVKDGKIVNIEVPPGGTYDFQGPLDTTLVPPTPFLLANKRWEMQDANWFPDFPTSAQNILWFYRHSRGVTADGVISINSNVFEKLLSLTGPISMPGRDLTLSADSAIGDLQSIIEAGPEKALNKPKQVLTDAAPLLLASMQGFSPQQAFGFLSLLSASLDQRDIQAYFIDPGAQAATREYGWAGAIATTRPGQDYLSVINTNIQGGKSDRDMDQAVYQQILIQDDGSIIDTVDIVRTHKGATDNSLYGMTNIDYIRLYVPEGSQLLSASGFSWPEEKYFRVPANWAATSSLLQNTEHEVSIDQRSGTRVTQEFGKYSFGNWVITEPGQTSHLHFIYRLPFKAWDAPKTTDPIAVENLLPEAARFQLVVQRQSGQTSSFDSQIIVPDNWEHAWHSGPGTTPATNGLKIFVNNLERDTVWSLALSHKK